MLDFGIFEIKTEIFILISSVLTLALQLLLCFKVKKRLLCLLPTLFFSALTLVFFVLIFLTEGWDRVGFLLLTVWTALLVAMCGIGWGIWGILQHRKINH